MACPRVYHHHLRQLVWETGALLLFPELHIPRSTLAGWLPSSGGYYHADRCNLGLDKDTPDEWPVTPRSSPPAKVVALSALAA